PPLGATAEPRAPRRYPARNNAVRRSRVGRRRRRRLRLRWLVLLRHPERLGDRRRRGGISPQLDGVAAVVLFREIDELAVVRLAQQLLQLGGLERLIAGLQLVHRLMQLLRGNGALLSPESSEGLADKTERAVHRERTLALGRLPVFALASRATAPASPPPSPPPPAPAALPHPARGRP